MDNIIEAGYYLQQRYFSHGLIRPEYIGYDNMGHYVLCDHMMGGKQIDVNYFSYETHKEYYMHPKLWYTISKNTQKVSWNAKEDIFLG